MLINFTKVPTKVTVTGNPIPVDYREGVANLVLANATGIFEKHLADKIYTSDGDVDYNDRELEAIRRSVVHVGRVINREALMIAAGMDIPQTEEDERAMYSKYSV